MSRSPYVTKNPKQTKKPNKQSNKLTKFYAALRSSYMCVYFLFCTYTLQYNKIQYNAFIASDGAI